jgi:glycosyltransferase involved in cell wall biosynthesis
MACGCAVATTDCGGNREYAEHEKTVLVSDPDDFESLVNNVLRLLLDEDLRVRIAQARRSNFGVRVGRERTTIDRERAILYSVKWRFALLTEDYIKN